MRAAFSWWNAVRSRSWRPVLTVLLVGGLLGAVALGALAGARRTLPLAVSLPGAVAILGGIVLAVAGAVAVSPLAPVGAQAIPSAVAIDLVPSTSAAQRAQLVRRIAAANPDGTPGGTYELHLDRALAAAAWPAVVAARTPPDAALRAE
jgi:hypothetical protein